MHPSTADATLAKTIRDTIVRVVAPRGLQSTILRDFLPVTYSEYAHTAIWVFRTGGTVGPQILRAPDGTKLFEVAISTSDGESRPLTYIDIDELNDTIYTAAAMVLLGHTYGRRKPPFIDFCRLTSALVAAGRPTE